MIPLETHKRIEDELFGKRILVIGGAGFIGSHLVDELLNYPVMDVIIYDNFCRGTMDNISEALKNPKCRVFMDNADIRDVDILDKAMRGIDYVFHLGALWLLHCKDFHRSAFKTNIEGTFNVIEACVKHKVKKLVYSSSASVYGNALYTPMDEKHPYNNENFYGATKICGEQMLIASHVRHGLAFNGLRYMNVYGERQDQKSAYTTVIVKVLNNIAKGKSPIVNGTGQQYYDFIHVKDVAMANILSAVGNTTHDFYNVGTGLPTNIKELCELLLKITNSDMEIKYIAYQEGDVRNQIQSRVGTIIKAWEDLGFKFSIGLEEGIKRLIEWRETGEVKCLMKIIGERL